MRTPPLLSSLFRKKADKIHQFGLYRDIMKCRSFYNPIVLRNQLQKISADIHRLPLVPRRYRALSSQLDRILKALEHLTLEEKAPGIFIKTQAQTLITKCCSLYRELEEGVIYRKLYQIQQESIAIQKGNLNLQSVKALETHLKTLMKDYAPSIEERRTLLKAKRTLAIAKKHLSQGTSPSYSEWLPVKSSPSQSPIFFQEAEELYALGQAVYEHSFSFARAHYHCFSQSIKNLVEKHLSYLNGTIFKDRMKTIQALIAAANDLVGSSEDYLSLEEIDQLYMDNFANWDFLTPSIM